MATDTVPLCTPEDSHDGPATPRRFGPYEFVRKLGRSMTDVYLARDTRDGRATVVKIVEESNDPYTQQVLTAERRGAAIQKQLHDFDPRFVEIYEYGQWENFFYVAMEYVEGQSVADMIRASGRIDPQTAARIAMEICSQLEKLHSHQAEIDGRRRAIVHGDIKPSNIQITSNGQVRLLDFGIAKVISLTRNLTVHDLGSPNYCSPERLASARVDQYADLWATGVSLYEMVSGEMPFQGESTRKLENIIRSKRPPRPLPPECPERLAIIIGKSLGSDVKRRYPTASAFASDLECFLNGRPTIAECEVKSAESNPTVESVRVGSEEHKTVDSRKAGKGDKDMLWQTLLRVRVPKRVAHHPALWGAVAVVAICSAALLLVQEGRPYLRLHTRVTKLTDTQIATDWNLFERLRARDAWLGWFSPAHLTARYLKVAYMMEAKRISDGFLASQDPDTRHFAWDRAQTLLEHAQDLDPSDPSVVGRLQLAKGYVDLNAAIGAQMSVPQHMKERVGRSWQEFVNAASLLPKSPDAYLGLARLYVYSFDNLETAIAEWNNAEQRGYKWAPREIEQEADGFRLRAEREMPVPEKRAAAEGDFAQAKKLYQSISNYDAVPRSLQILAQKQIQLAQDTPILAPPVHVTPSKPVHQPRRTQAWQSPKAGKRRKS